MFECTMISIQSTIELTNLLSAEWVGDVADLPVDVNVPYEKGGHPVVAFASGLEGVDDERTIEREGQFDAGLRGLGTGAPRHTGADRNFVSADLVAGLRIAD